MLIAILRTQSISWKIINYTLSILWFFFREFTKKYLSFASQTYDEKIWEKGKTTFPRVPLRTSKKKVKDRQIWQKPINIVYGSRTIQRSLLLISERIINKKAELFFSQISFEKRSPSSVRSIERTLRVITRKVNRKVFSFGFSAKYVLFLKNDAVKTSFNEDVSITPWWFRDQPKSGTQYKGRQ